MPNNVPDLSQNPSHYNPIINTKSYDKIGLFVYVALPIILFYFLKRK